MRVVEPLGLGSQGMPLQGGVLRFALARLLEAGATRAILPVGEVPAEWAGPLAAAAAPIPVFAGLPDPGRPLVMGIINLTPDSFSGDGLAADQDRAIAQGAAMRAAGADILDIGGESSRPGATPVPPEAELRRILPVIRALAPLAPVSVDTRNAGTMAAALAAGARIINDVTALRHDPAALAVVRDAGAPVVLMHMPGTDPRTMQAQITRGDVAWEVCEFLAGRLAALEAAGIARARIALDPGIGFGKSLEQNLILLDRLPILAGLGCPILLGASRKGFLGRIAGIPEPGQRLAPSLAAALVGTSRGAAILRVHDVAETVQALALWRAAQPLSPDQ